MRPKARAAGAFAVALLVASSTLAAKKDKKPKETGPEHKAGLMEEGEKDPAETETADDGQFAPGKKYVEKEVDENGDPIPPPPPPEAGEKKQKKRGPPRKTIGAFADAVIGFGHVPLPGTGNETTADATSFAFVVGGHFDASTQLRFQLRVPWTTAAFDGTSTNGGKSSSSSAFGNPELAARLRLTEPGDTEWAARVGIGIPIAQGNPDITASGEAAKKQEADAQRMADGANGWHDPELYAPKRIPISLGLLFTHRAGGFRLGADLKLVGLVNAGGEVQVTSYKSGTLANNGFAFDAILGANASYEIFSHFHAALATWFVYRVVEPIEYTSSATSPTPFQFVLEPKLFAQFGQVVPSIGYVLPVGGQLGGAVSGLRLHVDVIF